MKLCRACGAPMDDDAAFCPMCGAKNKDNSYSEETTVLSDNPFEINNKASSYQSVQNSFTQRQSYPNQTEVHIQKKTKKNKVLMTVMFVFIGLFLISVVASVIYDANAELIPADDFDPLVACEGEYVTTDIVYILPFYEYGTEKYGEKNITTYYCLVVNTDGYYFTVEVPYSYYSQQLSYLENAEENSLLQSKTVYGTVSELDADIKYELTQYLGESDELTQLFNNGNITLLSSPKKEANPTFGFAIISFFLMMIFVVIFTKQKVKLNNMKKSAKEYGDVLEIANQVSKENVYSDSVLSSSLHYIVSNKYKFVLVSTKEVLCLYQYIHRTNFVVDEVALIVINKYGEKIKFKYDKKDKDVIPSVIMKLQPLCPNAVLGYSSDTMNYIHNHKISRVK
ncbi:MAG: zinc ribbon domain-containing protein [Oscillospiraceae bacterium]|nr:zinc ribbon domain-containing protein [Oscillospiraceae bacterium]